MLAFGWLLLLGAVFALIQAFRTRTWSGFFLCLLSALLRGVTGYLLIRYPLAGEMSLTLILASFFIVGGTVPGDWRRRLQFPQWGWAAFSGIISVALGVMLLMQTAAVGPLVHRPGHRYRFRLRRRMVHRSGRGAARSSEQSVLGEVMSRESPKLPREMLIWTRC